MNTYKRISRGIYQRGANQFQVRIRRNGSKVTRTFESLSEAKKFYSIIGGIVDADAYRDNSNVKNIKLSYILKRYLEEVSPLKKGYDREKYKIYKWLNSSLADYPTVSIKPKHISACILTMRENNYAPSTISNTVNLLSAVFKKAREWDYVTENPCIGVARPKPRPARFATMDIKESEKLIAAAFKHSCWLGDLVALALETGMRLSEILKLDWNDVHPTHIHVRDTKNDESRDVPLTLSAETALNAIQSRSSAPPAGKVIKTMDGTAISQTKATHAFRRVSERICDEMHRDRVTFHDLRHISLTRLARLHANVIELAKTSGHRSLTSLSRYLNEGAVRVTERSRKPPTLLILRR